MQCTACHSEIAEKSRFCNSCGAPLNIDPRESPTLFMPPQHTSSGASDEEGRFAPGAIVAGRYRIHGIAGRGGMGEVYRAHDLTLNQTVALKFLPETAEQGRAALARFYNEVKIARQVSHPNVCRVYDIGDVDGQPYLSMEFIDGETLACLLRRIGRLPADKGLEMARRLCSGLSAAHAKGVLHRDFKPANIMVDANGQTLITDFGLAGMVGTLAGAELRNGTPAYMAPEQLAGKNVSTRSDIYALGLVLYEIFTGRRAFDAETLADLTRVREEAPPESPASLVRDLDPDIENVILQCLEPDPERRPASALAVAAALPGGDPLAEALQAGETPSPELLASAGTAEGMRPRLALACLAAVLAGLALTFFLNQHATIVQAAALDRSPEALTEKARDLATALGYPAKQRDHARGFQYDADYLDYLRKHPASKIALPDAAIQFWYRASPRHLLPRSLGPSLDDVTPDDPAPEISGMTTVILNPQGQLLEWNAVPPQIDNSAAPQEPDWAVAFAAAGLRMDQFTEVPPKWTPPVMADARKAWAPHSTVGAQGPHIEGAAWRGKLVFFRQIWPWTRPERMQESATPAGTEAFVIFSITLIFLILGVAAWMAWRNLRLGRGDQRGAFRLALTMFCVFLAAWAVGAKHFPETGELLVFVQAVSRCLYLTGFLWLCYVALEPYVRRRWPRVLISWARLLDGRFRDPLLGANVLAGVLLGLILALLSVGQVLVTSHLGTPTWLTTALGPLLGLRHVARQVLLLVGFVVLQSLAVFFVLFLLRVLLRKERLAVAAFTLLFALLPALADPNFWMALLLGLIANLLLVLATLRFGLVAMVTSVVVAGVLVSIPLTADPSAFYFDAGLTSVLCVAALAFYGFQIARAGKPIFKASLLDS